VKVADFEPLTPFQKEVILLLTAIKKSLESIEKVGTE
jgi:hypothetical protein